MLSDADLVTFLDQGYLLIDPQTDASLPEQLFDEARDAWAARNQLQGTRFALDPVADNLTTRIPVLHQLLEAPPVVDALTAVLGNHHFRYPHSFIHQAGTADQGFHKDSHFPWSVRGGLRSHRPNAAMLLYYPQETTVDMGPTRIIPGSQYWNVDHEAHNQGEDMLDLSFNKDKIGWPIWRRPTATLHRLAAWIQPSTNGSIAADTGTRANPHQPFRRFHEGCEDREQVAGRDDWR